MVGFAHSKHSVVKSSAARSKHSKDHRHFILLQNTIFLTILEEPIKMSPLHLGKSCRNGNMSLLSALYFAI